MPTGVPITDRELVANFDPLGLSDGFYQDPYPTYCALRAADPVRRCTDGTYFLTRHADVNHVYRNPRRFSSDKQQQFHPLFGSSPLYEHHTTSLVFNDPPLHMRVRKAIGDALSPKSVAAMEPVLAALVDGLLDHLADKRSFSLFDDFASAIPIEIIGNFMNIHRDERGPLRQWSNAVLGALEFSVDRQVLDKGNQAVGEFVDFLHRVISARRSQPGDDIISRLIQWESDGFKLSEHQIYHQCIFLLNAGHETTTNLIANGSLLLLTHPSERARIATDPRLIENAVEEFLRYESPVQLGNRITIEAANLGGVDMPVGTTLTLCIGAANRDPEVFAAPGTLDIARDSSAHNAFGGGIHTCAGLALARLEAQIAIARLFSRFPDLRLNGTPAWAKRARFRGLTNLPLAVD